MTERRTRWIDLRRSETFATTPRSARPWFAGTPSSTPAPSPAPPPMLGVKYVPVRCPRCKSKASTYKTAVPIRYHRCGDPACATKFRSVEQDE